MKNNEFYIKFNDKIKDLNSAQLKEVLNNIIRKVPEYKYDELLAIFNKDMKFIDEKEIVDKMEKYRDKFNLIDNFELYFHATGYEDYGEYYSPWGGDWIWEYDDLDDVGNFIKETVLFAVDLTNKRQYKYAKELFDLILFTNYQVFDDDGGDVFEISLSEIEENNLSDISVDIVCLYAIYVTYQYSDQSNRAKYIYEYFKNENFNDISVENSFKLGSEILNGIDKFWDDWILLLLSNPGNMEYRLLKEAFEYNDYANYQKYIDKISDNHPKIYIDIFDFLEKNNMVNEIINIGNEALLVLDKDLIIRNDIALYLAKYDENNKEKYIIESFKSCTDVPNLLRIINNGYFLKYKNKIEENICVSEKEHKYFKINELQKNIITEEYYKYLKFFTGNFDYFFSECTKINSSLGWTGSFIQKGVYLWLLYFDKYTDSKVYRSISSNVFYELGFKENMLFLDNDNSVIFSKWKDNFEMCDINMYINWLKKIIDKRVDAIVGNGHRGSYFKAAILVVALGEVLESNGIQSKEEFISLYYKKFPRHSSFKKELKEYM